MRPWNQSTTPGKKKKRERERKRKEKKNKVLLVFCWKLLLFTTSLKI
jgi:hypothetical protein